MISHAIRVSALALGLMLGVVGCAYQQGETVGQNPIARKFTWFSYLGGSDVRDTCSDASSLRLRAVYNGIYDEQVRTYDLAPRPGEQGAYDLSVRVIGEADLSEIGVAKLNNLLDPWRGVGGKTVLRQSDVDLLVRTLASDGALKAPPVGLELHSDDFYWVVSACIEGKASFHAFKWPQAPFAAAQFPALLTGWDMTGVSLNTPRKVLDLDDPQRRPEETRSDFQLRVGENGFWGVPH